MGGGEWEKNFFIPNTKNVEGDPFHPKHSWGRCLRVHRILTRGTRSPESGFLDTRSWGCSPPALTSFPCVLLVSQTWSFQLPRPRETTLGSPISSCSETLSSDHHLPGKELAKASFLRLQESGPPWRQGSHCRPSQSLSRSSGSNLSFFREAS